MLDRFLEFLYISTEYSLRNFYFLLLLKADHFGAFPRHSFRTNALDVKS